MPVRDTQSHTDRQTNSAENNGTSGLQWGQNSHVYTLCFSCVRLLSNLIALEVICDNLPSELPWKCHQEHSSSHERSHLWRRLVDCTSLSWLNSKPDSSTCAAVKWHLSTNYACYWRNGIQVLYIISRHKGIPKDNISIHIFEVMHMQYRHMWTKIIQEDSIRWQDSAPPISGYWPTSELNAG